MPRYRWAADQVDSRNPRAVLIPELAEALVGYANLRSRVVGVYERRRALNLLLSRGMQPPKALAELRKIELENNNLHGPVFVDLWEDIDAQLSVV
tara:strand:- start:3188 stop:3472 length:285 start_codon:yes stop_codon:yes gene_type:complete